MIDYEETRKLLLSVTGFDIGYYKPDQMKRLLSTIVTRSGAHDIEAYIKLLRHDGRAVEAFRNSITINVSQFFRDNKPFYVLEKIMLPELFKMGTNLEIWSAGCASGEEPYSVAMLLEENKPSETQYSVFATDIDAAAIKKAETAYYSPKGIEGVSLLRLRKYFEKTKDGYVAGSLLKSKVTFKRQDLTNSLIKSKFHLALCRNVVIYFTDEYKRKIYQNVVKALVPGGILFVGSAETLLNYREFGLEKLETYFYRKAVVKR